MNALTPPFNRSALILIVGLGETGIAVARWCARQNLPIYIVDTREHPNGWDLLQKELGTTIVQYHMGWSYFNKNLLDGVSQVVLSPGLAPSHPLVNALLVEANKKSIEVVGEIELFARALASLAKQRSYRPRLLAVTGTNGKTTVTRLTGKLIAACGLKVQVAGNIGPSALAALAAALDQGALPEVWVLELSSFQLETTRSLKVDAAIVLNITQDHLDWHGTMPAYIAAKARLLACAQITIINRNDPLVARLVESFQALSVRSLGQDVPTLVGDMGLENSSGVTWLTTCENVNFDMLPISSRRNKKAFLNVRAVGKSSRLMPLEALPLKGLHNALNVLAALSLARTLDLNWSTLLRVLGDYTGEPHRTEFVRQIKGVDFINDSKGTNVGATVAAVQGLDRPVILIAGGLGKNQDFSPLAQPVAEHARAVLLIGQDRDEIQQALAKTSVPCFMLETLQACVERALALAQPGDAVLLSPACASMDMFKNYIHRGQVFIDEVRDLAIEHGEVV